MLFKKASAFSTLSAQYSHLIACLSSVPLPTILIAYEEINLAKLFLISALSMGVSQRKKMNCSQLLTALADLHISSGVSVNDSELTAHMSVALQVSERRQDRLRDWLQCWCNLDWVTPLQLYSSTEFWVWYLMERKTMKRCVKDGGARERWKGGKVER